ncbi:hypothetical protein [Dongia sp.]|uniref:hypothetical protein n=1 Tax=Dongia sp. TaxID=1977262 RepID=UPI0035B1C1C8
MIRSDRRRVLSVLASSACIALAVLGPTSSAWAWESAHGDGPNRGFADVVTAPAAAPANVGNIGTFAPGSGPVTDANGTLYLGNQQGQLMSFQPNGTRNWTASIGGGQTILAAPVIDGEGSIYVVGTRTVRNDLVTPPLVRHDSTLYKFTPAGSLSWQTPFPNDSGSYGPTTSAPPNIWRSGGTEFVIVPAYYPDRYGFNAHLLAFARNGNLVDDISYMNWRQEITGESGHSNWCAIPPITLSCLLAPDFNPSGDDYIPDPANRLPADIKVPHPGAAIFTYDSPGTPFILVTDQSRDLVALTFAQQRFSEIFRVHKNDRWFASPPMVLPDGHTAIVTADRDKRNAEVFFAGPNMNAKSAIAVPYAVAAPTRMADGRIAVIGYDRKMAVFGGAGIGAVVTRNIALPAQSIVSGAASRSHLFVSTAGSFLTYDTNTLEKVAEISWVGGGTIQPIVGPLGHVYAMASNILFIFPPPVAPSAAPVIAEPGASVLSPVEAAPAAAPKKRSQRFSPPVTINGNRLFACQKLDGDDCGKSDARGIAQAFCEMQGFAKVDNFKTDGRKGKAETLDGQFCSKEKCKVFDRIDCGM